MEILSVLSKIGYVVCCTVFGYMAIRLFIDWLKTKNKGYLMASGLMVLVIVIAMSEVI